MSLTVVIYLPDGCGEQFAIPNGKVTTASQYFQLMIANLKLPDALAKKCFALWLKSPLLDVQLKPHHVPFNMVKQWPMLVERFSMASDQEKIKDEPALFFRRSAFLTKEEECQIKDEAILSILLMETRYNIQQGIYPCDAEDVEQLGALMCLSIEEKEQHGIEDVVKENLPALVPSHLARTRKTIFTRQQSMEERVIRCVKKASTEEKSIDCIREFMKICWQLPYYGSVMFPGFVEKAHNNGLSSWFSIHSQLPVRVAINTSGVWVIDGEKKHVLIGLLYDEFNWEVTDADAADDETVGPSLFLEFEDEKTKTNNLLQIVSKQASMMNSMIETCICNMREKEQSEEANNSKSDEGCEKAIQLQTSTRVRPLFERQNSVTSNHPEKLSLTKMSDADYEPETAAAAEQHAQKSGKNFLKKFGAKQKATPANPEEHELL